MLPKKLQEKLNQRRETNALRQLKTLDVELVDFSSNDYLGFSKNSTIFSRAGEILKEHNLELNGAAGSRLLSGNHKLYELTERFIAKTHKVEAALIFNSGYDANVGFFGSVPQRGDVILYDEFIHASIRDGIQMSHAKAYKFKHNDLEDLDRLLAKQDEMLKQVQHDAYAIYVVTESVFSMDGDSPDLLKLVELCEQFSAQVFIDEAHAIGVFGTGIIDELGLGRQVTRLVTFGKAMGCHGAAILGSEILKSYLVNFARSLIYTTALPPHSVATILAAYEHAASDAKKSNSALIKLRKNIQYFCEELKKQQLQEFFIKSDSAIHCAILPGNARVKQISTELLEAGFDVKAILSPTVPTGQERLRICLHSYNSQNEIKTLLALLAKSLE
ncbi:aminotransferase class I/II-fold pyridoxal phosphate-dependent enzyme [Leeuwenhoekiella sp. ZYFB001]|uniref:aminotransferase class I/II-fold pyridoxal phosphate-dependent enzyme n=1 Tax=Leeuwenhoekiella sp. ZYFB001 TaxID=2719912 RepID=UPI001431729E|nr:aminotransferase class I/II-fold pyridoxal phosphate-dependent enzyme [Leeuwenhoekiella sp. ZYFB001]